MEHLYVLTYYRTNVARIRKRYREEIRTNGYHANNWKPNLKLSENRVFSVPFTTNRLPYNNKILREVIIASAVVTAMVAMVAVLWSWGAGYSKCIQIVVANFTSLATNINDIFNLYFPTTY